MVDFSKKDFLPYMADIGKCSNTLSALDVKWDNIKLLCEMNCPVQSRNILPEMTRIQKSFSNLQEKLISSLISEELNKLDQKIIPKAQAAVDILIRNLYERTADIGFLATDGEVRRFAGLNEITVQERDSILNRLREYTAKYSVYNEVIILNRDFKVLANLDLENSIMGKTIDDPLLNETINSENSFVETFRKSPLQTHHEQAHIFSSKILDENSGAAIGIICLCFRFENETSKIFKKLLSENDGFVLSIIDNQNKVIASSDGNHLPVGTEVETTVDGKNHIVYYNGLEYISRTLPAAGYQGYVGLGWKGHVMVPLGLAFKEKASNTLEKTDPTIMSGLMNKADSFSAELNDIIGQTQKINRSLKSIVFNGQLITKENSQNEEFTPLRPLLSYISRMGSDISSVFEDSVKNLFATVISTSLRDAASLAAFCINIMDRNLYERADDCRWWALNPTFRTLLAKGNITRQDKEKLTSILTYINSLYTIYSNLFLFDRTGKIIAVSNKEQSGNIGVTVNKPYIKNILANTDESKYFVSPFENSPLYGGRQTYIYGASVTNPSGAASAVGGIGIVFDSEFQFEAMLKESLPPQKNSFCVFTDRSGNVISSTRNDLPVGGKLKLPERFFQTENGLSKSEILIYENRYYAIGCACSSGYREYKISDGYKNDVLAFVFKALADYDSDAKMRHAELFVEQSEIPLSESAEHVKLVSFVIGDRLVALKQDTVLESIDSGHIITIPESNELIRGAIVYKKKYVPVINSHILLGRTEVGECSPHLLIVRLEDDILVALEADQLNNVLEINESDIKAIPNLGDEKSIIKGVVCFENSGKKVMLVLNHNILPERMDKDLLKLDLENVLPFIEKADKKSKKK